ncbi:unnamed protein product [Sphagnum troendelagicum]
MDGDSTGTTTTVGSARGQRAGQTIMEDRERSFSGVRNPGRGGGGSGGRNCRGLEAAHRRECTGRAGNFSAWKQYTELSSQNEKEGR